MRLTRKSFLLIVAAALLGCAAIFSYIPLNVNEVLVKPLVVPTSDAIDEADLAIVLGAGLERNGSLSNVARERVDHALELYKQTNIDLMMSGGETAYGIEAVEMNAYANEHGYNGFDHMEASSRSTYENAFYSDQLLDQNRFADDIVLVITSPYHSRRALATFQTLMPERTILISSPSDSVILHDSPRARLKGLYNIAREYAANAWYTLRYGIK